MRSFFLFLSVLSIAFFTTLDGRTQSKKEKKILKKVTKRLEGWHSPLSELKHVGSVQIDSFAATLESSLLELFFSTGLSYYPIREETASAIEQSLKTLLRKKFRNYHINLYTDGQLLETLTPNLFRKTNRVDTARFRKMGPGRIPLVRRLDKEEPQLGLWNRNIALWPSHGWYYEAKLDRWEWQRARLYSTVEDIFPLTFVLPYLVPMLENAGANVFLPRERDTQEHEVIVDNDHSSDGADVYFGDLNVDTVHAKGFLKRDSLFIGENPFLMGSHLRFQASVDAQGFIQYIPDIPEDGNYAVYVSYVQSDQNIPDATYLVHHTGGTTHFEVDQRAGGSTWVFLGTFQFEKGQNPEIGSVLLNAESNHEGFITSDAIRFGGGMGTIARRPADELLPNKWSLSGGSKNLNSIETTNQPGNTSWKISQRARYQESARYYLQYAGFPDSLVYSLNEGKNDYNDDYQSRGEWVNYLMGAPLGPNVDRNSPGLNIPVDLSMAFHTDAGILPKDSIVGTLGIYSSVRDDGIFPDGVSKMVNRDLTDIVQSEIVHDIRAQFAPHWRRRGLWNKQYSEAWRPNAPAMLLELLSHQNLADIALGHDPRFKFAVSRAIYKAMVKFLAFQARSNFVIQPLPVDHFAIRRVGEKRIELSWTPVEDTLEASATPTHYRLYRRVGDRGFDNGQIVRDNKIEVEIDEFGQQDSYKVTAVNDGGESFPSQILSTGLVDGDSPTLLVVDAFDRVCAPAIVDVGKIAGIAHWDDEGVADKFNIGYTGTQYEFNRDSPWLDDDSPGWGASYGDMEGQKMPGNSFDNTISHGTAIMNAGFSYVSTSDEAFGDPSFRIAEYPVIDLVYGEEKTTSSLGGDLFTVFDGPAIAKISSFAQRGGSILASGAYIGSDHIQNEDTIARSFANNVLHFQWRTNHAAKSGSVKAADKARDFFTGPWTYVNDYHPTMYKVEAPDGIEPMGEGSQTVFRYVENNVSAATAFRGNYKTVVLGFPFESITEANKRNDLMKEILSFFDLRNDPYRSRKQ